MTKRKFDSVFVPFIDAVMDRFGYLVTDFGFEHFHTTIVSYECSLGFRKNNRVAVWVYCEAGALPWVMLIGRIGRRTEEAALDYVLQDRCPERQISLERQISFSEFPVPHDDVKSLLHEYAVALRECATDFLRGDPAVVHDVQGAVEKEYRRALRQQRQEERDAVLKSRKRRTKK
jgi:hypothetical protein